MEKERFKLLEERAKIFKALAHPTRLLIVEELSQRKQCVCEITDKVGADISTVSKHLSILRNSGIIDDEKHGTMMIYNLRMPCVLNFFECIEKVIIDRAESQMKIAQCCK
ncbi:winged helix-turn-helix transcriptional regulator [bacterium]|nr:winged helix-turn-helix transcriptional regulator [bacterium]